MLSKHAGLWITARREIFYSQATHITFICPMRFDAFPLDTQVMWTDAASHGVSMEPALPDVKIYCSSRYMHALLLPK